MRRLSDTTHELARQGLSGERGRSLISAGVSLADCIDTAGLSEPMQYAEAVSFIAERAPVHVIPGERIVGSATLGEALLHQVPILGVSSVSHTTLGFDRVLASGYKGLRARIEERLARGGLDDKGTELLDAMLVCLRAARRWHERYISRLKEMIPGLSDSERLHWQSVLDNARNVPEDPPSSFHESVQSLWFMYAFQRLCGTWSGIGRIDKMLGPYLKSDLAMGKITIDEARELLAHFWIKGTEWVGGTSSFGGSGDAQFYQNIVLSGIDASGSDVTNDVTYLVLDIVEELHISDFPIAVRINRQTPEKLLRRIAEVQRKGGGIVAIYNEEVVIKALTRFGYPIDEAREYANDGCWEAIIPGKTSFIYVPFDTLCMVQEAMGINSPDAGNAHASFDDLYAAFRDRLAKQIEAHHASADGYALNGPSAVMVSMFVDDCIERGRSYYDRGAKYTVLAPHAGGIANTANSLLAIKKLVYEEKRLTLPEFVAILQANWEGHEDLRREVLTRIPSYGNDDDEADAMVRRIYDDYTALCEQVRDRNGVLRPAGISTFGREIEWRAQRKATADGHRQGDILATNFSPSPGTDAKGPTAALRSYCKMDFTKLPNMGTIEMKILPTSVAGEEGVLALVGLMRTFVELGGCFMHIDVVDSQMLRDAQKNPAKYPNLSVRLAGWSARFNTLDHEWQDMVIRRTQQIV